METKNKLELIKDYLVIKLWTNSLVNKALPIGTKRQRKDGIYQKQESGEWEKVKSDKGKKIENNIELKIDQKGNYLAPNKMISQLDKNQFKQTRSANFKKWFGDFENNPKEASKIVDSNGDPQIIYHGTNEDFEEYDFSKKGSGGFSRLTSGAFKPEKNEIYLTSSESHAEQYGDTVKALYVNIKNPEIVNSYDELDSWRKEEFPQYETVQEMIDNYYDGSVYDAYSADRKFRTIVNAAKKEGKDGCIFDFKNLKDKTAKKMGKVIIAFNPNQIKSAINNNGLFGESNNINKESDIEKALPIGTVRQRRDGSYKKTESGEWVKIKDQKTKPSVYSNLPKKLTTLNKRQESVIVNTMKKKFSTHELKKRKGQLNKMIQQAKDEAKTNPKKKEVVANLQKVKALHDRAIKENLNPVKAKPKKQAQPEQQKETPPQRGIKLPEEFQGYDDINEMPQDKLNELKRWVRMRNKK